MCIILFGRFVCRHYFCNDNFDIKNMFPKNFLQCLLTLLVALIVFGTFGALLFMKYPQLGPDSIFFNIGLCVILGGVSFLVAYFINRRRKIAMSFNFIPKMSLLTFLWVFVLLSLFIFGNSFLINSFSPFKAVRPNSWLVYVLFFGPIVEEFMFRGIFLKGLLSNPKYPAAISIWGISILFALFHYNVAPQAPLLSNVFSVSNALILSLFMSWLFYKTMNVGNSIIVHILANTWILFLKWLFSNFQNQMQAYNLLFGILGAGLILLSIGCFLLSKNKIKWA